MRGVKKPNRINKMDDNVLSYLGIKHNEPHSSSWSEIVELEQLRNIRKTVTSTRLYKIQWGVLSVLIGEEHHYGSI